jgi:hypothetical protein
MSARHSSTGSGDSIVALPLPATFYNVSPATRPLRIVSEPQLAAGFEAALRARDGASGAHFIHELWMRGAHAAAIETGLQRLWQATGGKVPEWLPTQFVSWLPVAFEVAAGFSSRRKGRNHVYLVLLDFSDRRGDPHGVYVGQSSYPAARRFEQHKAGIRASGAVLKRGLEVLTGPVLHLTRIPAAQARAIEAALAGALADAGLRVEGGH